MLWFGWWALLVRTGFIRAPFSRGPLKLSDLLNEY
jgi:hypothetical protein